MAQIEIRLLEAGDIAVLLDAPPDLFDDPVTRKGAERFLQAEDQLMVLAFDAGRPVAFASGTVLRHPDKEPSLFVNEVGTVESHQRRGLARSVVTRLMAEARARQGCHEAWLGTEPDNAAALGLYRAMGGDEGTFKLFAWGFRWEDD